MDEVQAMKALLSQGATVGSLLFVSYSAGREPTERAQREARRALRQGISRHHFTGRLTAVERNARGEFYFTIFTPERDNEETGAQENYRSFNPSVGTLHSLQVIS